MATMEEGDMPSLAENKQLVRAFIDGLFTEGDLAAVDRYLAPGFVNHDPFPGLPSDRESMRQVGAMFRTAFPDWHSQLEFLIAEGDLVAEKFTARGTSRGPILGVAPTGREVSLPGINIFRVENGAIVERWGRLDDLDLLQQLGVLPASPLRA